MVHVSSVAMMSKTMANKVGPDPSYNYENTVVNQIYAHF